MEVDDCVHAFWAYAASGGAIVSFEEPDLTHFTGSSIVILKVSQGIFKERCIPRTRLYGPA
jgi:hypothetical protein